MDELNKDIKPDETKVPEEKPEGAKTYTEEEHKAQLQSETDKRVSQALKTAQEKWETEFKEKLAAEKSEAEKFATMTAEERTKAELDAQKSEFEKERQSFLREKLELETIKELSAEGLPTDFSTYVMADTAEETSKNIKTFKVEFQKAIQAAVDEKLTGRTPKTSNVTGSAMSRKEFGLLSPTERQELYEANPKILDELI